MPGEVIPGQRWQHVKRGTSYEVIGLGTLQMSSRDLIDGETLVLYRGDDGKLWAREESEFVDGRFVLAHSASRREGERDPLIHAVASLRAAISLLERGGKKAAPSDKMFEQMLSDYRKAADNAAAALLSREAQS